MKTKKTSAVRLTAAEWKQRELVAALRKDLRDAHKQVAEDIKEADEMLREIADGKRLIALAKTAEMRSVIREHNTDIRQWLASCLDDIREGKQEEKRLTKKVAALEAKLR